VKIISVVSAKGGVGKTTLSANLCSALKKIGNDVLAVDLDPQNSLRLHFGINPAQDHGVATLQDDPIHWSDILIEGQQGCLVLPFGTTTEYERAVFEQQLHDDPCLLSDHLSSLGLDENTTVVIDTPPGPSIYLKQALSVANVSVIVNLADAASYATIPMIDGLISQFCQNRPDFICSFFVINQLDRSRKLASDIADIMVMQFDKNNISIIHQDQSIPEALAFSKDTINFAPNCRGTHDFIDFSLKISNIINSNSLESNVEKSL
jgi:cellulose synthase operon protein YhjQ